MLHFIRLTLLLCVLVLCTPALGQDASDDVDIAELQDKIHFLEADLEMARKSAEKSRQRVDELEKEVRALKRENGKLEDKIDEQAELLKERAQVTQPDKPIIGKPLVLPAHVIADDAPSLGLVVAPLDSALLNTLTTLDCPEPDTHAMLVQTVVPHGPGA